MLNILVTGSKGQVGSEIEELSSNYAYNFFFTDREELDITNEDKIQSFVQINSINIIINCAAYTAVDKAEEEQSLADKINNQAVKYLAEISKKKTLNSFISQQIMSLMEQTIDLMLKVIKPTQMEFMGKQNLMEKK